MNEKIKPRPFCGAKAELGPGRVIQYVECTNVDCGATGPLSDYPAVAVEKWNIRISDDNPN
jgi:hypothetical protein